MAQARPTRSRSRSRSRLGWWSLVVLASSLFGPAVVLAAPSATKDTSGEPMAAVSEAKFMVVLFARDGSASKGAERALDVVLRIDATDVQRIVFYRPVDEQSPTIDAAIELYGPADVLSAALGKLEEDLRALYEVHAYSVSENLPLCYERDWVDGATTPGVTNMSLIRRRDSMTREEFSAYWAGPHAKAATSYTLPAFHYSQNTIIDRRSEDAAEIDGIGKVMFRHAGDFERRRREWPHELLRSVRDAKNFMQLTTSVNETMTETVLRSEQPNPPRCDRTNQSRSTNTIFWVSRNHDEV